MTKEVTHYDVYLMDPDTRKVLQHKRFGSDVRDLKMDSMEPDTDYGLLFQGVHSLDPAKPVLPEFHVGDIVPEEEWDEEAEREEEAERSFYNPIQMDTFREETS